MSLLNKRLMLESIVHCVFLLWHMRTAFEPFGTIKALNMLWDSATMKHLFQKHCYSEFKHLVHILTF